MVGGRVGYKPGKSSVLFNYSWCDMSVLGSQVFGQASMESCDLSHVTNANSHSHRPSPIIYSRLVHSRVDWSTVGLHKKSKKVEEKKLSKPKKSQRYAHNSNTAFDQRSPVHWEASFLGCDIHTYRRTTWFIDWIGLGLMQWKWEPARYYI